MTSVGGIIEQKPIGLQFGVEGTHNNTELVNGKVQLKQVNTDANGNPIYATQGTWISKVIDIGDEFADYGKVFTAHTNSGNSSIKVETRTSSDGVTFDDYAAVGSDGTILSTKRKHIQMKVTFYSGFSDANMIISSFNSPTEASKFNNEFIDTSNGLTLKRNHEFDMTKDNTWSGDGSLHKKKIIDADWSKIGKLNIPTNGTLLSKTLILHDGEHKKWNEKTNILDTNKTLVPNNDIDFSISSSHANHPYSNLFDKDINTLWHCGAVTSEGTHWFKISKKISDNKFISLNGFMFTSRNDETYEDSPSFFVLQGSDGGNTWVDIEKFENINWTKYRENKSFTLKETVYYKNFRILVSQVDGRGMSVLALSEMQFYGEIKEKEVSVSKWSKVFIESIHSDGMDSLSPLLDRKLTTLEPLPMLNKSDISLNNGNPCFSKVISLARYLDIRNLTTDVAGQIKLSEVGNYDNLIDFISVTDVYDNFTDEFEVILIPSGNETEAHITLTANWSPIDELDGDFEVVTLTDELNASKKLELNAIPSPQFIHTTTLSNVTGELKNIISSDLSTMTNDSNVRYLLTKDSVNWLKWNGSDFTIVSFTNKKDILNIGMTYGEIMAISDWSKWTSNKINIGVYLQDDDTTTSKVGSLGFVENSSNQSTKLSNVNFYILNTTAKIELDLQGLLLSGHLSDLDSTRVQYKVTLNGQPYYPASGGYTSLSPSPQNIDITFKSSEIKMNDWNTLRVDFKDYFGTEDYWQTTFVGNYSALMFMDVDGNYYSDDVGKVLQYLDFGNFTAGEVTVAHEVVIKNQYGYAVKDLQLEASRSHLPEGVDIQLSKVNDPFEPEQSLLFEDGLIFEDQTSFYVRMVTDVDSVPNDTKSFNIFVKASRKGV